jgi:hypothetical protein
MDWKGPLHNVGQSLTSSTFGKINLQSHLQGLMAIQMVDLIMIKHVTPMFSWEATPSPCNVVCHQMPFNDIKTDSTMCTKLAQVSHNLSLLMLAQTTFALMSDFWEWLPCNELTKKFQLKSAIVYSMVGLNLNNLSWRTPKFLVRLKVNLKCQTTEFFGNSGHAPSSQH